jgi:phosphoenolpyruvate phosphomutase
MILVHSKSPEPDEVLEFARRWDRDTPLVCVPTTYKSTNAATLADGGFRVIIYANQGMRAAIKATRCAFGRIFAEKNAAAVDELVVPLTDVYELIGVPKMKEEEESYLPAGGAKVGAIILAAGASPELGELTEDRPKAMLDIKGKSLLGRQVEALNTAGIRDISVVVGWKKESVDLPNLRLYEVEDGGGEVMSLMQAAPALNGPTLVLYGDILFDPDLVLRLLQADGDVVLVVDRAEANGRMGRDLVRTINDVDGRERFLHGNRTDSVSRVGVDLGNGNGEWIGMLLLSEAGAAELKRVYDKIASSNGSMAGPLHEAASLRESALTDLLQALIDDGVAVRCVETYKGWMEVDTFEDYRRAWAQVK